MSPEDLQTLLEEKLPHCQVSVDGDGYKYEITVVTDEFEGLNPFVIDADPNAPCSHVEVVGLDASRRNLTVTWNNSQLNDNFFTQPSGPARDSSGLVIDIPQTSTDWGITNDSALT